MEQNKIKNTEWTKKPCDICHSNEIKNINIREYLWPTREATFKMELQDSICNNCGYLFVSQIPNDTFLSEYYRTAFYYDTNDSDYQPDYDINKRLKIISEYLPLGSSILEVGDNNGHFTNKLNNLNYKALGTDLLEKDSINNSALINKKLTYDAIISYFVLEHITLPNSWLSNLKLNSHEKTIFILEIPDFEKYPFESLNHEHFLHCSPFQLHQMMESNGFKTLYLSREACSRYFGFLAVFCLKSNDKYQPFDITNFSHNAIDNMNFYKKGIKQKNIYENNILRLSQSIITSAKQSKIILWGANEHATAISHKVAELNQEISLILVDGSKQKQGKTHQGFHTKTLSPIDLTKIKDTMCFCVCAIYAYETILNNIKDLNLDYDYLVLPQLEQ